jgi:hypothetical protein
MAVLAACNSCAPKGQPELVGGLEHFLLCHILGRIIPSDELIFFRGVETTNQIWSATCTLVSFV